MVVVSLDEGGLQVRFNVVDQNGEDMVVPGVLDLEVVALARAPGAGGSIVLAHSQTEVGAGDYVPTALRSETSTTRLLACHAGRLSYGEHPDLATAASGFALVSVRVKLESDRWPPLGGQSQVIPLGAPESLGRPTAW